MAELSETGLAGSTIARLHLDLARHALAAGTVVILDEISQTSTRDIHTASPRSTPARGAQLWVLGDARQSPAVKAGGIAVELEQRIAAGVIPGATLTVNRRQLDLTDRAAVGLLRGGDPVASQRMRTVHGWEHDAPTVASASTSGGNRCQRMVVVLGTYIACRRVRWPTSLLARQTSDS